MAQGAIPLAPLCGQGEGLRDDTRPPRTSGAKERAGSERAAQGIEPEASRPAGQAAGDRNLREARVPV